MTVKRIVSVPCPLRTASLASVLRLAVARRIRAEGERRISAELEDKIVSKVLNYQSTAIGDFFISDWLRNRNTLEFLGGWERLNNPAFNPVEFDGIGGGPHLQPLTAFDTAPLLDLDQRFAVYSLVTSLVGGVGILVSASVNVFCTIHININLEVLMHINAIVIVGLALLGSV